MLQGYDGEKCEDIQFTNRPITIAARLGAKSCKRDPGTHKSPYANRYAPLRPRCLCTKMAANAPAAAPTNGMQMSRFKFRA